MKNIEVKMTKAEKILVAITIVMCLITIALAALTPVSGIFLIFLTLIPQLFMPAVKAAAKKGDSK